MEKSVILIRGLCDTGSASFQKWYLEDFAPSAFAKTREIDKWHVNVVTGTSDSPNTYDVVSELWGLRNAWSSVHEELSKKNTAAIDEYEVEERIEKSLPYSQSSAIKVIGCTLPLPGLGASEIDKFWDSHVAVALDVHVGMARYVRNLVIRRSTNASPAYFGFPMLTFPTNQDFTERYFGSPDAKRRHALDIGQFVGPTVRLISTEHVLSR